MEENKMAKRIKLLEIDEFVVAWQRNRYEKTLVYQGRDGKLYPIIGRARSSKSDRTKIDVPFFFHPEKAFTVDGDSIRSGIVKIFNTKDGRECRIVIAEVTHDVSPEMFRRVVKDDILAYVTRDKQ
jgi:hypothetical protein